MSNVWPKFGISSM